MLFMNQLPVMYLIWLFQNQCYSKTNPREVQWNLCRSLAISCNHLKQSTSSHSEPFPWTVYWKAWCKCAEYSGMSRSYEVPLLERVAHLLANTKPPLMLSLRMRHEWVRAKSRRKKKLCNEWTTVSTITKPLKENLWRPYKVKTNHCITYQKLRLHIQCTCNCYSLISNSVWHSSPKFNNSSSDVSVAPPHWA